MNLHLAFEQMRARALSKSRNSPTPYEAAGIPEGPPRVLILGPENAGKTTACKTLINYAVRSGQQWAPMFINVDPSDVNFLFTFPFFLPFFRQRVKKVLELFVEMKSLGMFYCSWNHLCLGG